MGHFGKLAAGYSGSMVPCGWLEGSERPAFWDFWTAAPGGAVWGGVPPSCPPSEANAPMNSSAVIRLAAGLASHP
jgi:hypothetical protein